MKHKSDFYIDGVYKNGQPFHIEFKSNIEIAIWIDKNKHTVKDAVGTGLVSMTVVSIHNK